MRATKLVWVVLVVLVGVVVVGGGCGGCMIYNAYTTAIRFDEEAQKTWADVDVVLKRRFDLIDNMVETVKGYTKHERETLESVVAARSAGMNASGPQQAASASFALTGAMRNLIKVVNERYPDLKANEGFRDLRIELEGSENRIAEMRKRYNAAVQALNSHIRGPLGSLAAGWAGVEKAEYFQAGEEAQEVPTVRF